MRTIRIKPARGDDAEVPIGIARHLISTGHAVVADSKPKVSRRSTSSGTRRRSSTSGKRATATTNNTAGGDNASADPGSA